MPCGHGIEGLAHGFGISLGTILSESSIYIYIYIYKYANGTVSDAVNVNGVLGLCYGR